MKWLLQAVKAMVGGGGLFPLTETAAFERHHRQNAPAEILAI